jgi:hypothetical protein
MSCHTSHVSGHLPYQHQFVARFLAHAHHTCFPAPSLARSRFSLSFSRARSLSHTHFPFRSLISSLGIKSRPMLTRRCRCLQHTCRKSHSPRFPCTPQARKPRTPLRPPPPTPDCIGRLSPTLILLLIRRAPGSQCTPSAESRCKEISNQCAEAAVHCSSRTSHATGCHYVANQA